MIILIIINYKWMKKDVIEIKMQEVLFYMLCLLKPYAIMSLHNFLSL